MSIHVARFQSFYLDFLHDFVLTKLGTSRQYNFARNQNMIWIYMGHERVCMSCICTWFMWNTFSKLRRKFCFHYKYTHTTWRWCEQQQHHQQQQQQQQRRQNTRPQFCVKDCQAYNSVVDVSSNLRSTCMICIRFITSFTKFSAIQRLNHG